MKSSSKITEIPVSAEKKSSENSQNKLLRERLADFENEKKILLDLSDAIIKVREKDDLIKVFASKLKGLFYFEMWFKRVPFC